MYVYMLMLMCLQKGKAWMMQLLAVACVSLAAKMDETEVPLCLDLQVHCFVTKLFNLMNCHTTLQSIR